MARRSSVAIGVAGVVLVVSAAAVEFVLAPDLTKFPDDTDIQFDYSGTASLLNAEALQTGDMSQVFLTDVPITIERQIKVQAATDDTAAVGDQQVLKGGDKITIPSEHTYALDRSSLEMRSSFEDVKVEKASACLAIGFPLAPEADDSYKFYDPSTQECFKADYSDEGSVSGRDVYNYTVTATGPLKDPGVLASLPPALPKQTLAGLASQLPQDLQDQLGPALATLPDPVPLTYLSDTYIEVAADQATGFALSQDLHLKTTVALNIDGATVPIMPVFDVNASISPKSVENLSETAASTGRLVRLVETILPLGLLILGLLLIAFAVVQERRKPWRNNSEQTPTPGGVTA